MLHQASGKPGPSPHLGLRVYEDGPGLYAACKTARRSRRCRQQDPRSRLFINWPTAHGVDPPRRLFLRKQSSCPTLEGPASEVLAIELASCSTRLQISLPTWLPH